MCVCDIYYYTIEYDSENVLRSILPSGIISEMTSGYFSFYTYDFHDGYSATKQSSISYNDSGLFVITIATEVFVPVWDISATGETEISFNEFEWKKYS